MVAAASRTEYQRKWRTSDRRVAWLERNRQRLKEYHAAWRAKKKADGVLRNDYVDRQHKGLCPSCCKQKTEEDMAGRAIRCLACRQKTKKTRSIKRAYLKRAAIEYLGSKCRDCQQSFGCAAVYDFHHRDGEVKSFTISWAISSHCPDFETIKTELDKCDLLCANCHRVRHFSREEGK